MSRVHRSLERLKPVAPLQDLGDHDLVGGKFRPDEGWRLEGCSRVAETGPDQAAALVRGVGGVAYRLRQMRPALLGLGGNLLDLTVEPIFPAVVQAPQATLLVTREGQ